MAAFKTVCAILFFLILLIAVTYAVSLYLKKKKLEEIKNKKLRPKRHIHERLGVELFKWNVFSGFLYPTAYSKNGVPLDYTDIDTLAVTRGGIALVTVKDHGGLIDNGKGDVWVCRAGSDHVEFENPLSLGEDKRKAILSVIKRKKLPDVPVYNIVVFTGEDVSFVNEYDNVVDKLRFFEMISELNSERVLDMKEMFALRELFNDEKRTRAQVKEHKKKIYG